LSSPGVCCAPAPETAAILASALSTSACAKAALPPARWMRPEAMPSLSSSRDLEDMVGRDPLVAQTDRHGLRRLQEALGAIGEFSRFMGTTSS